MTSAPSCTHITLIHIYIQLADAQVRNIIHAGDELQRKKLFSQQFSRAAWAAAAAGLEQAKQTKTRWVTNYVCSQPWRCRSYCVQYVAPRPRRSSRRTLGSGSCVSPTLARWSASAQNVSFAVYCTINRHLLLFFCVQRGGTMDNMDTKRLQSKNLANSREIWMLTV